MARRFNWFGIFTLFLFLLMIGGSLQQAKAENIVIGVAVPKTGISASFGDQMIKGTQAAIDEINEKGGVLGKKLQIIVSDDHSDPRDAVSVANQLAAKRISLVIGHFDSSASIAASSVYNEEGMLEISPATTNPNYTKQGFKTIFRLCGRDDVQGATAANYIIKHFRGKNIAILDDKTAFGHGIAEVVKNTLNKAGITETSYEIIATGEKDYSALVVRLAAKKIDVVFHGGHYQEAGVILRQMREHGQKALMIGGDAFAVNDFWPMAGDSAEGTLYTFEPNYSHFPSAANLVAKFKAKHQEPEGYFLNSYASVQVLAAAIAATGSTKGTVVANYLHTHEFDTILGKVNFDANGDWGDQKFVFYRYSKGKATEVGPDPALK